MADWGAGYANAASGLASIFMGKAQQNVRGREQAAEQARMLKEQKRQEMQELRKMGFQREMQESDRAARMGLMKQEQAFRKEESAAERALRERQLAQNEAYNQGQLGLQARGLDLRTEEMKMLASNPQSATGGVSANRMDTALMQEYSLISEAGDSEAKAAAAAIYGSGLPLDQKLARLRALRGRLDTPTDMEMIR